MLRSTDNSYSRADTSMAVSNVTASFTIASMIRRSNRVSRTINSRHRSNISVRPRVHPSPIPILPPYNATPSRRADRRIASHSHRCKLIMRRLRLLISPTINRSSSPVMRMVSSVCGESSQSDMNVIAHHSRRHRWQHLPYMKEKLLESHRILILALPYHLRWIYKANAAVNCACIVSVVVPPNSFAPNWSPILESIGRRSS